MTTADHDLARQGDGAATDAVTFSFADGEGVAGLFRLGLDPDGAASVFGVLFEGREPVAAHAESGLPVEDAGGWSAVAAGPLRATIEAPLERWSLTWEGDGAAAELSFGAAAAPATVPPLGGMEGYEQLCDVTGTVRLGGRELSVAALGQRGHLWGTPDWRELELTRSVAVWLEGGDGVTLASARPAGASGHDEEETWAALVSEGEPVQVADPRLSTTYDGDGHQRRAGLELWVGEEDGYPQRASGRVLCGSTLDLGPLRLDVAFFTWQADGREGPGRYDILRRA